MNALLPSHSGLLPYFLLYCGTSALIHTVSTYFIPTASLRQFSGPNAPPHTTLLAHVYGVKNIYTGLIRLYTVYHITSPELYVLAMCTFAGVFFLYVGELIVWKTVRMREGAIPLVTSVLGLVWMLLQWGYYTV